MKVFLITALLSMTMICHAQEYARVDSNFTKRNVWRVVFLAPGVTNEFRLGPRSTFVSALRLGGGWTASGSSSTPGNSSGFNQSYYLNTTLSAGVRQFYNFERRLQHGKSIRYNSGNYLMVNVGYISPPFVQRNDAVFKFDPKDAVFGQLLWGFQRTYRRNFYLNLALGVGASTERAGFASDFTIGYTFPSK